MSAKELLKRSAVTLTEVTAALGYDDMADYIVPPTLYPPIEPPQPLTNRRRALRFLRKKLWCQPWAAFHRMAPGQCECDCGDE